MKKIEIIQELEERTNDRKVIVLALCHCGKQFKTQKRYILKNKIKSCGCSRSISAKNVVLGNFSECNRDLKYFYNGYKRNALKREREFTIDMETFRDITTKPCHYCADLPCSFHGLDRLNNFKGYSIDNVVSCCSTCNFLKGKLSTEKFLDQISKIHNNLCSSL